MKEEKTGYFEAALSDFVFDVAAGGAIRHLVDRGHSVEQIMSELSYPVPRGKVEKAVYRYLSESGILLNRLPDESGEMHIHRMYEKKKENIPQTLVLWIEKYGEVNSYMECPFGKWIQNDEKRLRQTINCLTSREQEYILGIRWEQNVMYHRLNGRMREIGMKLAAHTEREWAFYFLEQKNTI